MSSTEREPRDDEQGEDPGCWACSGSGNGGECEVCRGTGEAREVFRRSNIAIERLDREQDD